MAFQSGRYLGLSRSAQVPRLLQRLPAGSKPVAPVADDAPPLSTDSSENECAGSEVAGLSTVDSDSDTGPSRRGDIRSTRFVSQPNQPTVSSSQRTPRLSTKRVGYPSTTRKRPASDDVLSESEDDACLAKKTKSGNSGHGSATSDHARADPFASSQRSSGVQSGSSRLNRTKTYTSSMRSQGEIKEFKKVPSSAKSVSESPRPTFTLKKAGSEQLVSPVKHFRAPRLVESPARPSTARKKAASPRSGKRRTPKNAKEKDLEESQPPVFVLPGNHDIDAGLENDFVDQSGTSDAELDSSSPVCPLCNEPVDQELLDTFKKGARMTVLRQTEFCYEHRKRSARDTWEAKGYPDIDWLSLDERLAKHYGALEDILDGATSHFGDVFWQKVKSGKSRTLLREEDSLVPGYYGNRGLRAMSEGIIRHFASKLRQQAVRDRLVSARGHTAFVQAVLVPELAVRLIMEDGGLNDEGEARSIMKESVWVGELINEDVEDAAAGDAEDEVESELSDDQRHSSPEPF